MTFEHHMLSKGNIKKMLIILQLYYTINIVTSILL